MGWKLLEFINEVYPLQSKQTNASQYKGSIMFPSMLVRVN